MRYISHGPKEIDGMLKSLGLTDIKSLYEDIPDTVKLAGEMDIPQPQSEVELRRELQNISKKNKASDYVNFIGGGAYDHYVPAVVNAVVSRSEFYTSYTPYQAERSQGTLAAIFEYQSMISNLTGMDVVNASIYDGASSLGEAILMACNIKKKNKVVLSGAIHPEYITTAQTYSFGADIDAVVTPYTPGFETDWENINNLTDDNTAALVVSMPNFFGVLEDIKQAQKFAREKDIMLIVSANPISLALLKPPSEYGADIVVGEGQPLGNPLNFGGPYLGFMGTKSKYVRRMPGRIVGETVDADGKRAFVLTLQAREQHIRREKATSNICSNQALNALAATVYLSYLGKKGLKDVAYHSHAKARYFIEEAEKNGIKVINSKVFNELVIEVNDLDSKYQKALDSNILPGLKLEKFYPQEKNKLLVAFTEKRTKQEIQELIRILGVS
ncbi:MAG: aminomethyl-transferring glycine dehydrogenase subunit GcvPA [Tepidanaerobacteraceae bacterium]|jgi:glycine dehydrogenase subunit 1